MSKRLTEEEKERNRLAREERAREKDLNPELNERCYEILRILREAPEHPETKYNSIYFQNHFKVANITILRDIQTLKDLGIIEEKQQHGSYVIKKFNSDEDFYSRETAANIALIASVKGLLQQYKNTPMYESLTKLIYFLEPKVAKNDTVLSSARVTVPPQIEFNINQRNWDKVYEGIQKNHKISFRYTKSYTNNQAKRIIWPYQLLLSDGDVYVFAHSEYNDVDLLYDLNFMTDVCVTNEAFDLPQDFDFASRCAGGRLGAFKGSKVEKFKIKFTGYAKDWIKQHKMADDQEFTETEDATIITFSSSQFEKVLELIFKWRNMAEPLAPKRLIERWKADVTAMYEMMKD